MNIYEIRKEIYKLDDFEKRQLILDMLVEKEISFVDVTLAYIKVLQNEDKIKQTRLRLSIDCLTSKYQKGYDKDYIEFIDARSKLLMTPYVNDTFLKNTFKHVSIKAINKQKKFLKKEGILE